MVLHTRQTVLALAFHGSDIAWLSCAEGSADSLWMRGSGRTRELPLPSDLDEGTEDCDDPTDLGGYAQLAFDGTTVGWLLALPGGNWTEIAEGVSSAQPRQAETLATFFTASGWPAIPEQGQVVGGVASTRNGLVWGTAHIAYRRTVHTPLPVGEDGCDEDPTIRGCQTRVDRGGVLGWFGGDSTSVRGLPPVLALASGDGLLALATLPRSGWRHGYARIGGVEVRDDRGRVLMRTAAAQQGTLLAVSQHLLAIESFGWPHGVAVYDIRSERLLRRLLVAETDNVAVVGDTVVLWNAQRIVAIDPRTGRRRTIVSFAAPPRSGEGFYWSVTAVAADGNDLAWAQTIPDGPSVVHVLPL